MAYVYMLRCRDGSYYVGCTSASLDHRIAEHDAGKFGGYTAARRPVKLVFSQEFQMITDAIAAERQRRRSSSFETLAALAPRDDGVIEPVGTEADV